MARPVYPAAALDPGGARPTVTMGLRGVPMVKSSGAAVPALRLSAVPRGHRWAALVVLCASALTINVDNTILNEAAVAARRPAERCSTR